MATGRTGSRARHGCAHSFNLTFTGVLWSLCRSLWSEREREGGGTKACICILLLAWHIHGFWDMTGMVISRMLSTVIVGRLILFETLWLPSWCFPHSYKLSPLASIVSLSFETISWSFAAITILEIVGTEEKVRMHCKSIYAWRAHDECVTHRSTWKRPEAKISQKKSWLWWSL